MLCEFQTFKKKKGGGVGFREMELALAWFWSSLAIRGSGGGLVWPQIHEIRLCLPNGWYGDTRDSAGLDFQVCLLSFKTRVSIDGRSINSSWPKAAILWATRADVVCAAPQNVGPCDSSGGRLETNCKIAAHLLFLCPCRDSLKPRAPLNSVVLVVVDRNWRSQIQYRHADGETSPPVHY